MKHFLFILSFISFSYLLAAEPNPPAESDNITCPIEQKSVKNGAAPDIELFKKLVRCKKGEKAAPKGEEGSVKVDISAIKVGDSRPWSAREDLGGGKVDTIVYPVKVTYSVTTYYRKATEYSDNWERVLNFYVNSFGEWQIGSEESISAGKFKRVNKD